MGGLTRRDFLRSTGVGVGLGLTGCAGTMTGDIAPKSGRRVVVIGGGWGGAGEQMAPPIEPGQAFIARFVPPRAGTFIYHTHWHNFLQLTGGLYGPLIVLQPGQKLDPETDKTVDRPRWHP